MDRQQVSGAWDTLGALEGGGGGGRLILICLHPRFACGQYLIARLIPTAPSCSYSGAVGQSLLRPRAP